MPREHLESITYHRRLRKARGNLLDSLPTELLRRLMDTENCRHMLGSTVTFSLSKNLSNCIIGKLTRYQSGTVIFPFYLTSHPPSPPYPPPPSHPPSSPPFLFLHRSSFSFLFAEASAHPSGPAFPPSLKLRLTLLLFFLLRFSLFHLQPLSSFSPLSC